MYKSMSCAQIHLHMTLDAGFLLLTPENMAKKKKIEIKKSSWSAKLLKFILFAFYTF